MGVKCVIDGLMIESNRALTPEEMVIVKKNYYTMGSAIGTVNGVRYDVGPVNRRRSRGMQRFLRRMEKEKPNE